LPAVKAPRRRHANSWLEVDRSEKNKAMVACAVVLTALVIGRWFLVHGVRRGGLRG
jgi:hypothetical protein